MAAITCQATVERIETLAYNVRTFRFKLHDPPRLDFQPGQFMIVHVPKNLPAASPEVRARAAQADGPVIKRAYSIASPPHETGVIELCIQHVEGGIASTFFWQLKEGTRVVLSGPHGRFTLKEPLTYQPVFLATGTGVAPFRSMIKHLIHVNFSNESWLLLGCRYEHALLYDSEFRALSAARPNFHYIPTVSRPKEWKGETGHVQQTFQKRFRDVSDKEIYVCGWLQIVKAIVKDLESFGVPKSQIHYEEWT